MTQPTFSVIIPTLNRRDYVLEAVRSVKEQTYPAHEIIVVVDGGTDDTPEALRAAWPDVIVYTQPNLGRAVACNTGVSIATGEWVCFLDDDDLWHREKLAATVRHLHERPECRAVRNPVWFFTDSDAAPAGGFGFSRDFVARDLDECHRAVANGDLSKNEWDYLRIEGNSFAMLLERNRGVMSSTVIHRQTFVRAGGFCPMQSYTDDWTLFVNVARLTEWHTVPRRLGFTRLHATQSTADSSYGLNILAGLVNAWYGGRPMPERVRGRQMLTELARYGPIYRATTRHCFWSAVFARQFRLAWLVRRLGRMLLPRWRDRVLADVPPHLVYRWEKYALGRHRAKPASKPVERAGAITEECAPGGAGAAST
ncbi:MAG: glycosyltransferase family A protein [Tepidisphaeraceae bacterium]